jgi:nucleoside 2-deoxyribosyltransferase
MTTGIPLIYVAGPFSASTRARVDDNIVHAVAYGLRVARAGGMPVVPHANTAHPDYEHAQSYEFWVKATAKLMTRCDGVLLIPDWVLSRGACGERELAIKIGLPVFDFPAELDNAEARLVNWIAKLKGE